MFGYPAGHVSRILLLCYSFFFSVVRWHLSSGAPLAVLFLLRVCYAKGYAPVAAMYPAVVARERSAAGFALVFRAVRRWQFSALRAVRRWQFSALRAAHRSGISYFESGAPLAFSVLRAVRRLHYVL